MFWLIPVIFAAWTVIDVGLLATTGNDSIGLIAVAMGWTGQISDSSIDNIYIESGMEAMDFVITNWFFILLFITLVVLTMWYSTRPLKAKGSK